MQIERASLEKLFDNQIRYLVPNYQRLYVWGQDDQWEPLWLDVQRLAEALLADALDRQQPTGIDENAAEPHFMGAVVLKNNGLTPGLATQYRVVDGQQRLTTLQLLLMAAGCEIRVLNESHAERLLDLVSTPVRNRNATGPSPESGHPKISFQRHKRRDHDYESFGPVMHAALSGIDTTGIDGPLANCYRYFCEAVRRWLGAHHDSGLATAALGAVLLSRIFVIGLYLDPHEKEHIIFETLNARGKPLTEWDKTKNYLLYVADESPGLDPTVVFEDYLDPFDDEWWRQEVGRGIQARPRIDVFLDYWLESKIESPVSARRVFRQFQEYLEKRRHSALAVLEDLVRDAEYFRKWESAEVWGGSRESVYHFRRHQMNLGVIWPVLLRLSNIVPDQIKRGECLEGLESYFACRLICGRQARSYDRVAMDLLRALPPGEEGPSMGVVDTLMDVLYSYSWDGALWPSAAEVKEAVLHRWMPGYVRRFVLAAIERHLIPTMAGNQTEISGLHRLHVEHIMPIGWKETDWPLPNSDDREAADRDRTAAIQSMGNLTLLNKRLNQSISNSSWAVKREKIEKSDNLFLTSRLLKDAGDAWTEDGIRARGEWMYNQVEEIWRWVRIAGE